MKKKKTPQTAGGIRPIMEIAEAIGLVADDLELYGKYKAKVRLEAIRRFERRPNASLILVSAMTPTPAGEGKTTVSIGLTQALAKELGRYLITVNAVCPGYIWTPMWEKMAVWFRENFPTLADKTPREIFDSRVRSVTPLRRPQDGQDIAALVAFLASEEAKNITGQSINVDGGARMH
jgi:NAD(P)-dependent dehydrogenase (short-subunit alcohol dehydrogenase family)